MKKMVAKSLKGSEFFYSRFSAYAVPVSSADKICKALNDSRWNLDDNEVWHVHDCGSYELENTSAGYRRMGVRNGRIYTADWIGY